MESNGWVGGWGGFRMLPTPSGTSPSPWQVGLFLGEAFIFGVAMGVVERGLLFLFIMRCLLPPTRHHPPPHLPPPPTSHSASPARKIASHPETLPTSPAHLPSPSYATMKGRRQRSRCLSQGQMRLPTALLV